MSIVLQVSLGQLSRQWIGTFSSLIRLYQLKQKRKDLIEFTSNPQGVFWCLESYLYEQYITLGWPDLKVVEDWGKQNWSLNSPIGRTKNASVLCDYEMEIFGANYDDVLYASLSRQ